VPSFFINSKRGKGVFLEPSAQIIIIIASHEDEMNDKYNDELCTSNKVIQ